MKAGDERSTFVGANRQFSSLQTQTYFLSSLLSTRKATRPRSQATNPPPPPTKPNFMILV